MLHQPQETQHKIPIPLLTCSGLFLSFPAASTAHPSLPVQGLRLVQPSITAPRNCPTNILHFRVNSTEPPPWKSQSPRHSICPLAQCPRSSGLVEFYSEVQQGRTNHKKVILLPIPVPWPGVGFLGSSAEVAGVVGGEQSRDRKSSSSLFPLGEREVDSLNSLWDAHSAPLPFRSFTTQQKGRRKFCHILQK